MNEKTFFERNEELVKNTPKPVNFDKFYEKKVSVWPLILFVLTLFLLLGTVFWAFNSVKKVALNNTNTSKTVATSYFENKSLNNQKLQEIINSTPVNWQNETVKSAVLPKFLISIPEGWKAENFEGAGSGGYYQANSPRIFATSLSSGVNAIAFSVRDNAGLNEKTIRVYETENVQKVGNTFRIFDSTENMTFYVEKSRVFQEDEAFKKLLNCEDKTLNYPKDFCKNLKENENKTVVVGDLIAGFTSGENVEKFLPTCQKDVNTQKCSQNLPVFIISTASDDAIPDEIVKKATF